MSAYFNGKKSQDLYFNGKKISEAYFNGDKVFSSGPLFYCYHCFMQWIGDSYYFFDKEVLTTEYYDTYAVDQLGLTIPHSVSEISFQGTTLPKTIIPNGFIDVLNNTWNRLPQYDLYS